MRNDWTAIVLDVDGPALMRALRSIDDQTFPASKIIVVDNGSVVPVSERFRDRETTRILRFEQNSGFTGGVNAAFELVDTEYVALINNDVALDGSWAQELIEELDASGAAAAQGILMREDGLVDGAGIAFENGRIAQLGHGQPIERLEVSRFAGVSATAAIYRSAMLRSVAVDGKVLHPKFFAYYEDVELAARLMEAGFAMRLVPKALGIHAGSASAALLGREALRLRARNRYYVARLHPELVSLTALFTEDLERAAGCALRGRLAESLDVLTGVIRGLS